MMEATNLLGKSDPNGTMTTKGKLESMCVQEKRELYTFGVG